MHTAVYTLVRCNIDTALVQAGFAIIGLLASLADALGIVDTVYMAAADMDTSFADSYDYKDLHIEIVDDHISSFYSPII